MRRGLRMAVMVLAANLLVLALLEGALWLAFLVADLDARVAPPMPKAEWRQPLCPSTGGKLELCASATERDARARPTSFSRKPSRQRIIIVGESFVHGLRLKESEAWPARLSHHLGGTYEVLNFGVCGSEMAGLDPLLEALPGLKPNLVILAIGNNEYTMAPYYGGLVGRHPVFFSAVAETLSATQLFGAMRRWIFSAFSTGPGKSEAGAKLGVGPFQPHVDALRGRPPRNLHLFPDMIADPDVTAFLEGIKRLNERFYRVRFRRAVARLKREGVRVVLATLPRRLQNPPILSGLHTAKRTQVKPLLEFMAGPNPGRRSGGEEADIRALAANDPRLAVAQYGLGNLLLRADDRAGAAAAFRRAAQWDLVPDVTPRINGIIREAAADFDAPLLDLAKMTEVWLGKEAPLYIDPIHMTADGADALAKLIAEHIQK